MVDAAKAPRFQVPVFGGPHDGLSVPMALEGLFAGNRVTLPGNYEYVLHPDKNADWRLTYVQMLARMDPNDITFIKAATVEDCIRPEGHEFGEWFRTPKGNWGRQCMHCPALEGSTRAPDKGAQ